MLSAAMINKWYSFRIDRCAPCLYFYAVEITWYISITAVVVLFFVLFGKIHRSYVPCLRSHFNEKLLENKKRLEDFKYSQLNTNEKKKPKLNLSQREHIQKKAL